MATTEAVGKALAQPAGQLQPADRLETLLKRIDIKDRLDEVLGKRSAAFASSILSLVNASPQLKKCQPVTIIGSAMVAATLDLPVNKQLGFAYIVPYGDEAQFQMGYKGYIQLAMRSGQYKTIHATEVYRDEIKKWDPLHGDIELTDPETWKQRDNGETDKIVGFMSYLKLLNGFEKTIYMTKKQVLNHAKRYSKSFGANSGIWKTNEHEMCVKTPLRLLLSKYGVLSVDMQTALRADQAVIKDTNGEVQEAAYVDAVAGEAVDADAPPERAAEPAVSTVTGKPIEFGGPQL